MSLSRLRGATTANSMCTTVARSAAYSIGGVSVGASYILDTYTAYAAWDVAFQLKSDQTKMILVRQSDGDTEAWIGPSGGELDQAALLAHTGANNGFIVTVKDANNTASTLDATQATTGKQFKIVATGTVLLENGKPAATTVDNTQNWKTSAFAATLTQPQTYFAVYTTGVATGTVVSNEAAVTTNQQQITTNSAKYSIYADASLDGGALSADTQKVITALFNGVNSKIRENGSETASGNAGTDGQSGLTIGALNVDIQGANSFQSLILFDDDQTANFAAIETAINALYGAY